MKFHSSLRCLAVVLGLAHGEIEAETAVPTPEKIHTWQRWEHALISARGYDNPYTNVIVRVTYTGPERRTLRTYGFWDGGNTFRIRCAFPAPGKWQWETECSDKYYDEPYLDIAAVQTGHDAGHLDWCAHHAIEWVLHLYRHEPHKPVINLEAMYDAQGTNGWRAADARSLGWRSWLSGAMGYTYGAGDMPPKVPGGSGAVWKWVTDPAKYDYWKKALQWDSALQMQYLHDFLAALEWWRFEPAHELIRNQPGDVTRRMVLAKTAAADLAVAYLPDNDAIEVDLSQFPGPLTGRWFDPVRGQYTPLPARIAKPGTHRFTPPAKGDWVLLLQGK